MLSDGSSGSYINDGFGGQCYHWLERRWDNVVVLLDGNPLHMVEEVYDEADMYGVPRAGNFIR